MLYDIIKIWYPKFKNKDYAIQVAECSGRPTDVDEVCLQEPVEDDHYSTNRELANETDVNIISVNRAMCHINLTYKFNLLKQIKIEYVQADSNCPNINARTKFWTGFSLVTKSEFISTTQLLPYSPYSPIIASSDLYRFSHLQLYFSGAIFNSTQIQNMVDGLFEKLIKHCQKIINLNDDYYSH